MATSEVPEFLKGAFDWKRQGYFYPAPPELLRPESLVDQNPWIVLCAVVEHAKRGDRTHIAKLRRFFVPTDDFSLDRIVMLVTGVAGTEEDLRALLPVMETQPDLLRAYACEAASLAGPLWIVPHMLDAWLRVEFLGERESIGYSLSDLLEQGAGEVADNAGIYVSQAQPPPGMARTAALEEYLSRRGNRAPTEAPLVQLVLERHRSLVKDLGSEAAPIWNGQLFSVKELAARTRALIQDASPEQLQSVPFTTIRHKFEASTGIDCTSFFEKGRFQPLAALTILEEFLESGTAAKYIPGVRYFFGHAVATATKRP